MTVFTMVIILTFFSICLAMDVANRTTRTSNRISHFSYTVSIFWFGYFSISFIHFTQFLSNSSIAPRKRRKTGEIVTAKLIPNKIKTKEYIYFHNLSPFFCYPLSSLL
jgi:hypothetical protein